MWIQLNLAAMAKEARSFAWWGSSASLLQSLGAALRNDLAPEWFFMCVCVLAKSRDVLEKEEESEEKKKKKKGDDKRE